jgi:protein subunit release factor A
LRIHELDKEAVNENFWNDPVKAREVLQEKSRLRGIVDKWQRQNDNLDDMRLLHEIAAEEKDHRILEEIQSDLDKLNAAVRDDELKMMLGAEQEFMPEPEARKHRIGQKCSCGCICVGRKRKVLQQ